MAFQIKILDTFHVYWVKQYFLSLILNLPPVNFIAHLFLIVKQKEDTQISEK